METNIETQHTHINTQANRLIELNAAWQKHLDFSINSLKYIEKLIEEKADKLINSISCMESIASYVLKTLLVNYNGSVITSENPQQYIYQQPFYGEQINTFSYVYDRVLEKYNSNSSIVTL